MAPKPAELGVEISVCYLYKRLFVNSRDGCLIDNQFFLLALFPLSSPCHGSASGTDPLLKLSGFMLLLEFLQRPNGSATDKDDG